MNNKFIGAVFLILGTCIGGSMLALPLTTANQGVSQTLLIMFFSWSLMTLGAYALLHVNLKLPENSNLITMAKFTLGNFGAILTWVVYLLLLYTLLSAYISSGEDLVASLFLKLHITTPAGFNAALFTLVFGLIVFQGIRCVDYINRGLMSSKLIICLILLLALLPFTQKSNLLFHSSGHSTALLTCITAFGYACIIPSIRSYLKSDVKKLRWAIFLGGVVPLICYLAWIFVVQATVQTDPGLSNIANQEHPIQHLVAFLSTQLGNKTITILTNLFTSICVLTSFLGVALSLSDFLADGLKKRKEKWDLWLIAILTLLPPLVLVMIFPSIFIKALNYAGILCVLLLFVLPLLMNLGYWLKRYRNGVIPAQAGTHA